MGDTWPSDPVLEYCALTGTLLRTMCILRVTEFLFPFRVQLCHTSIPSIRTCMESGVWSIGDSMFLILARVFIQENLYPSLQVFQGLITQ